MEDAGPASSENVVGNESNSLNGHVETMETQGDVQTLSSKGVDDVTGLGVEHPKKSAREEVWEESGCVLWDLAASKEHAEFMVQNYVLEVLLANVKTSDSARITEISLGILGNLVCHETVMDRIDSTNGLLEVIVDQVFSDDAPCLCEVFRLLTSGIQGSHCAVWAKALQAERILSRVLWIAENTLNPILIERTVALLLAIIEGQQEVAPVLLPTLMNLGMARLLVNLLGFEMGKLTSDRIPERYAALDFILRAIEALSVIDGYSEAICSNKELFQMAMELVKIPEKIEISSSCVTAAVLIANILSDATGLASEIVNDCQFLQSLLDVIPFTSDDFEARNALWSILTRVLYQVQETEMTPSSLGQLVLLLVNNSELIEDILLDNVSDESAEEDVTPAGSGLKLNSRTSAIKLIVNILNKWNILRDDHPEEFGKTSAEGDHADASNVQQLLNCCLKHLS